MISLAGHSEEFYVLMACCTLLVGYYGYFHAKAYWEGLPPVWDAFIAMAGFLAILGAFAFGGRIGNLYGHPHAGRLLSVTVVVILYRSIRTWIGKGRVKYRKTVVREK